MDRSFVINHVFWWVHSVMCAWGCNKIPWSYGVFTKALKRSHPYLRLELLPTKIAIDLTSLLFSYRRDEDIIRRYSSKISTSPWVVSHSNFRAAAFKPTIQGSVRTPELSPRSWWRSGGAVPVASAGESPCMTLVLLQDLIERRKAARLDGAIWEVLQAWTDQPVELVTRFSFKSHFFSYKQKIPFTFGMMLLSYFVLCFSLFIVHFSLTVKKLLMFTFLDNPHY